MDSKADSMWLALRSLFALMRLKCHSQNYCNRKRVTRDNKAENTVVSTYISFGWGGCGWLVLWCRQHLQCYLGCNFSLYTLHLAKQWHSKGSTASDKAFCCQEFCLFFLIVCSLAESCTQMKYIIYKIKQNHTKHTTTYTIEPCHKGSSQGYLHAELNWWRAGTPVHVFPSCHQMIGSREWGEWIGGGCLWRGSQ